MSASPVRADQLQNAAVAADPASLAKAGFTNFNNFFPGFNSPLNGELITVANVEAEGGIANTSATGLLNTSPRSTLPNGNLDLPSTSVNLFQFAGGTLPAGGILDAGGPVANPYPAGLVVGNHASEVTGVIVGQGKTDAADTGIATGSTVEEGGIVGGFTAANGDGATEQQAINTGAKILNLSLGAGVALNNGNSQRSQFVDWATTRFNTLITIAGNEVATEVDSPADSFNGMTIGATGVRVNGVLSYDQLATYNTSLNGRTMANATSDGRIGMSMVAPGGDPGPVVVGNGTMAALPAFNDMFKSTAGGQYELLGTVGGLGVTPVYTNDAFTGVTSANSGRVTNTTGTIAAPFPAVNPNPAPAGADTVSANTIAGTSFAAPMVAGAGAVVLQYGTLATTFNIKSSYGTFAFSRNANDPLNHLVEKSILMNGASKVNADGTLLTRTTNTPWTRSTTLQGAKPLPAILAMNTVGSTSTQAQSGLDPVLGSGQLNLVNSLVNYAAGEQGPGAPGAANVKPIGWDYETVAANAPANTLYTYNFPIAANQGGFQATLNWDRQVNIANAAPGNMFQPDGTAATTSTFSPDPAGLTDLDLYLFQLNPNGTMAEIGFSNSLYDNSEHIYDQPTDANGNLISLPAGNYQLDVIAPNGNGALATPYGLAWSTVTVPEPTGFWFVGGAIVAVCVRRRRQLAM